MSDSVQMPALGESVTEGTVTRWLKQVGERIEVDEPLLEVSTDKVDTEIPSPLAGVVEQILVGEDETVEVGAALAVIGDGSSNGGAGVAGSGSDTGSDAGSDTPSGDGAEAQAALPDEDGGGTTAPESGQAPPSEAPSEATPADTEQPAPQAQTQPASDGGTKVTMPALGESVTEGTVTRWLKSEGDSVEVDEPLLEVSTDKVDTEIPSPVGGVLQKILVSEDETVAVGADLAVVGDQAAPSGGDAAPAQEQSAEPPEAEETPSSQAPEPQPQPTQEAEPPPAKPQGEVQSTEQASAQAAGDAAEPAPSSSTQGAAGAGSDGAGYVTPLVRRMASEQGVDLTSITGTGVGGRIRKQDVLDAAKAKQAEKETADKAAAQPQAAPAPGATSAQAAPAAPKPQPTVSALRGTTEKMTRLRKVIAQRMVESLQTSAQLTTVVEVDVTRISRLRDRAKRDFLARENVKLSFLPFFALSAVEALKQFPVVNASIDGDQIVYHGEENLGIAVDTERGLLVPVIHGAGDLNIAGLARKIADLADRTRRNKVTPDELGGGTFTLTNTGSRGALFDTPIINQPQVAILGTGNVVKRPVVVADADGGESIGVRSIVYLALSYDHRLVDGADGARFLVAVKDRLEEGAFEADLGL